ncbi:MAG: type II toxin-antitoxin system PemK/MazF family toxin [Lachnospiraceae bacterium]|nr:type II toxin-antitoxin system PemK/MazF family toxin [Lachnospiraceae bacterium]
MIGKLYWSLTPYYDSRMRKNSFKKRPVLIIAGPRNNDYTILPISTISNKANLDTYYDIEVKPTVFPLLNLKQVSYIRVHKQTTVHRASLTSQIGNLKDDYEDLYLEVLEKLEEYNQDIMEQAI